jgi:hypothetical protein
MNWKMWCSIMALAIAVVSVNSAIAKSLQLSPYKDKLFQYPGILETGHKGDFVKVTYDKYIDIHKRDVILEREVKRKYVSEKTRWSRKSMRLTVNKYLMKYFAVGEFKKPAKFIVVYVHGSGGSRFQGVNDWTFGGNFNRIQNLALRNGGLYLSPDFSDYGDRGTNQIKQMILRHSKRSPGAPVFIACGSKGGFICWRLTRDARILPLMGGMLLFGSTWDDEFFESAAIRHRLPIYFGHGSWDNVLPWKKQFAFFERIKKQIPSYPAKFSLFNTGTHGTPIRMTDWRLILNWMLKIRG